MKYLKINIALLLITQVGIINAADSERTPLFASRGPRYSSISYAPLSNPQEEAPVMETIRVDLATLALQEEEAALAQDLTAYRELLAQSINQHETSRAGITRGETFGTTTTTKLRGFVRDLSSILRDETLVLIESQERDNEVKSLLNNYLRKATSISENLKSSKGGYFGRRPEEKQRAIEAEILKLEAIKNNVEDIIQPIIRDALAKDEILKYINNLEEGIRNERSYLYKYVNWYHHEKILTNLASHLIQEAERERLRAILSYLNENYNQNPGRHNDQEIEWHRKPPKERIRHTIHYNPETF